MALPQSAGGFLARCREVLGAARLQPRIVFPEGDDARVLAAAGQLAGEELLRPVLIGRPAAHAPRGVEFIEPALSPLLGKYARLLWERRRSRGLSELEAREQAACRLHFAALMVAAGDADGQVAGAVHATADSVRALLEAMDLRPGVERLSSAHIVAVEDSGYGHRGLLVFADAAIILRPSSAELAGIAVAAAEVARTLLEAEPLVALLSFSTKGSARHKEADRVIEALRYLRERAPELVADGELQADAALAAAVGRTKAPGSLVAGRANTLIFPDLHSANIGCKLVERLGEAALLAVMLTGLEHPASIVSRGCSAEDVVQAAMLAAVQAARARAQGA